MVRVGGRQFCSLAQKLFAFTKTNGISMDAKILKYISVLFCFIFDFGHLREPFVEACRFSEECLADEYCDESINRCIKKIIARDFILSESPLYERNKPQKRWTDEGYDQYERDYDENYLEKNQLRQSQREDWESEGDDYEFENRNIRHPAQSEGSIGSRHREALQQLGNSDQEHGPLPPVTAENWGETETKNEKGRVNLQSSVEHYPRRYNEHEFYNALKGYNERLPAKRRLHQRDQSSIGGVNDVQGKQGNFNQDNSRSNDQFFPLNNAGMVDRRTQDFDSSEESQRLSNSEAIKVKSVPDESLSAKQFSDDERGIPPVPLEKQERPNPGGSSSEIDSSHGSQLQTEKQALTEDAADVNSSGSTAKGKVMVKGKVQQIKDKIDQGPNPEKTYQRVEDFFESQRESSIVEVPNAVKKEEATKLFKDNFVPAKGNSVDEVSKEQAASPVLMKGDIALSLNRKLDDGKVKLKMARTDYTLEDTKDVVERIRKEPSIRGDVARSSGLQIVEADYEDTPSKDVRGMHPKQSVETQEPKYFVITIVVVGCVTGVVLTAVAIYLVMKRYNETKNFRPITLPGQEAAADYQELCRQLRATQGWDSGPVKSTHLQEGETDKGLGSGRAPRYSWSEEPVVPNMDISTGHVVLAYMEDHLNNKDRLNKEWEALKTYEAEPNSREIGKLEKNGRKNRYSDVLPYDHNRVLLKETASATGSDYVNASYITDHDPKNPAYIATQGPLAHTVSDFWQMVWEQGVVVIVNLTKLSDLGLPQCHRYWPEDGQPIITYRIYEVHLVSEHIWCEDYLVRSFYLKNLQTSETRTVTQFHFLSWPDLNVPSTPKPLLEFRRKVNKCFRGRASPVVVHCSGGVGRTGTYILIDMVLNKMMRGAKEIDIAATVEHLRDQRPFMVKTKAQFEFALRAVAEEVNAILRALSK